MALALTAFPATPRDVAVLSIQEFTSDLDDLHKSQVPSLDRICRTFTDDANRALVWWIRFGALQAWCARTDAMAQLNSGAVTLRDACELAASFPLNHNWEFEPNDFCSAIAAVTVRRQPTVNPSRDRSAPRIDQAGAVSGLPLGTSMNTTARVGPSGLAEPFVV